MICLCCPSIFYSTGKDQIIFVTKEDHETPSSAELIEEDPNDPYEERGEEQLNYPVSGKTRVNYLRININLLSHPRSDSAQWGDQLELPLPGWDGQWSLWD